MERFVEEGLTVLVQTELYVAGKQKLQHGSGKEASETQVYVLIRLADNKRRYYLSSVISRSAFREMTENKATMETLSTNFNGRDEGDMKIFLAKNYIAPKVTAPAVEQAA